MIVDKIIWYLFVFIVSGCPLFLLYSYFMKKLQHIKEVNGFTDMDNVFKGSTKNRTGIS